MDLVNYYVGCLKNYAGFSGRARRKEYWMFILANYIVMIAFTFVGNLIRFPYLVSLYSLAVIVPSFAVCIRRLHDIGKSGVWVLISCIPCIGQIWYLILMCQDSMPGTNEYGVNPKEVADSTYM